MRHAHSLGSRSPVFYKLFDVLLNEMKGTYPELKLGKDLIIETLKMRRKSFPLYLKEE